MRTGAFIWDHAFAIILWAAASIVAGLFLMGLNVGRDAVTFVEVLFAVAFWVPLTADVVRRTRYWRSTLRMLDALDRKDLIDDILREPSFADGQVGREVIESIAQNLSEQAAESERARREYREYLEQWIHEVKTPIASAQLTAHNHPGPEMRQVALDLGRIEARVMQALYYARSAAVEKDYIVEKTALGSIVDAALRRNSRELIAAKFRIEKPELPEIVYTDPKWLGFVLDQIIQNAVKYRGDRRGILRFEAREYPNRCTLTIEDGGIGVPDEDLPRVFDKGFTGAAGREYAASTGMGLYISARLIEAMNHDISADHGRDVGFRVTIGFPRSEAMHDINLTKQAST